MRKEPPRNKKIHARSNTSSHTLPRPPAAKPEDVWRRVDELLAEEKDAAETAKPEEPKQRKRGAARRKQRRKRRVRALDVISVVLWAYIVVKLFIGDLDRELVGAVLPQIAWILDLRFFVVLVIVALFLMLFKARTLGLGAAYVIGFPLVVVCWKLPALLIRRRSKLAVLGAAGITGAIGVVYSLVVRSRTFVIALALWCVSGLVVALSAGTWLTAVGAASMFVTLMWWLAVTAIDLLRTPRFVAAQEKLIKKILAWKVIENLVTPEHPDVLQLKAWTVDDAKKYQNSAGGASLTRRLLYYWAYALDEYRRGPSAIILNAIAAVGMVAVVVAAFSFINFAAFTIAPSQFQFKVDPDGWTFAYYSFAAMYGGEVGALSPVAGLAIIAKTLNGAVGLVGVSGILISSFLNYRASRSDVGSTSAILLLKSKAQDLEEQSMSQFHLSVDELEERLIAASWGLVRIVTWISAKTPVGWMDK